MIRVDTGSQPAPPSYETTKAKYVRTGATSADARAKSCSEIDPATAPRNGVMTYDQFMEALCIWREARGASFPAKQAVLSVIRNRVADKRFPNTSAGVITQPWQFSSFNASDPNCTKWPLPGAEWQAWQDCLSVVETPLTADPTNGATNYESLPEGMAKPKWADDAHLTCKIGPFIFYRL